MAARSPIQISLRSEEHEKLRLRAQTMNLSKSAFMVFLLNRNWEETFDKMSPRDVAEVLDKEVEDLKCNYQRIKLANGKSRKVYK